MAQGMGMAWMPGQRSAGAIIAMGRSRTAPVDQQTAYGSWHRLTVTHDSEQEKGYGETIHTQMRIHPGRDQRATTPRGPFPVEVLPPPLARFVQEVADALPCPPDFVAVPMLALLGCAIGTSRVLRVKPGWLEGPRIFTAVVADTGTKKSPALKLAA
jgi:hypothetical protein